MVKLNRDLYKFRLDLVKIDGLLVSNISEEITLVREIRRQRALNRFFRTYYSILLKLRYRVTDISDEMLLFL